MTYSLTRFVRPLNTSTWRQPIRFLDKSLQGTKDKKVLFGNSYRQYYIEFLTWVCQNIKQLQHNLIETYNHKQFATSSSIFYIYFSECLAVEL